MKGLASPTSQGSPSFTLEPPVAGSRKVLKCRAGLMRLARHSKSLASAAADFGRQEGATTEQQAHDCHADDRAERQRRGSAEDDADDQVHDTVADARAEARQERRRAVHVHHRVEDAEGHARDHCLDEQRNDRQNADGEEEQQGAEQEGGNRGAGGATGKESEEFHGVLQ